VIVGVRPEVALALVEQQIDLTTRRIYPTLEAAVTAVRLRRDDRGM
jgi:hypothetical protein